MTQGLPHRTDEDPRRVRRTRAAEPRSPYRRPAGHLAAGCHVV